MTRHWVSSTFSCEVPNSETGDSAHTLPAVGTLSADMERTNPRAGVLIPWPNRLQDGSYEFDGRRHQLPLNEPARRNAIHGLVRWVAWTVASRTWS